MRRYAPVGTWLATTLFLIFMVGWWVTSRFPDLTRYQPWLLARAAGVVSFVLLSLLVLVGLAMSQPTWKTRYYTTKRLLPWHRAGTLVFVAFLLTHILAIALDPYVAIGWVGALIPFQSEYRPIPVALGTLAWYFVIVLAFTAYAGRSLFGVKWLTIHRLAVVVYVLAWFHAVWTGSDALFLKPLYVISGTAVAMLLVARFWSTRPLRRKSPADKNREHGVGHEIKETRKEAFDTGNSKGKSGP